MTIRAETQIDLTRVDDGTPGANGATFTPSVDAAGDISWTNDGGLPNPATQNIKGPAGNTPYIQGGYWYINGTSTGVKAEGEDGTTSVWYYGNKITGTSTTPTVFSGSGIANAVVGDMYLNTDNSNVYQCTLGGNASTAKWVYAGTIADGIITVKSVNGSIASFADASEYPALEVITDINAKQAGTGTPSPSNPRAISGYTSINTFAAGKNLLHHIYPTNTVNYVTFTLNADYSVTANGTASANAERSLTYRTSGTYGTCWLKAGTYKLLGCPSGGGSSKYEIGINTTINGSGVTLARDYGSGATFTLADDGLVGTWITVRNGVTVNNLVFKPMIVVATETDTTYEPYNGNIYTTPLPSTVYGGTLDVTSGLLTVTDGYIESYNGEALPSTWISSKDVYASGTTPTTGAQVVYTLATPVTYSVTPQQIMMLSGTTNNVWTDSGDVDVKYAIISASAVEALREPIDNASKVATSYITQIDEGGIKVHDAGDTSNYAKIDATGMNVYKGGDSVAFYGDTSRVGKATGAHVTVSSNGMEVFGIDGTTAGNINARTSSGSTFVQLSSAPTTGNSYLRLTSDIEDSYGNAWSASKIDLVSSPNSAALNIDLYDYSNSSNRTYFRMGAGGSMWYCTESYAGNEAQIEVTAIGSTADIWMGIGSGGTAHGVFSETNGAWIAFSDGTYNYTGDNFGPWETSTGSNGYYLGWNAHRWRGVYSYDAPNSISDRKHKNVIGNIDFAKDLIMGLEPIEFQWKESDHKRTHMGLIAQDSAEVAKKLGKDLSFYEAQYKDGSDYHGEEVDDENLDWGMMYSELIAPLIKVVQEQQHEIDELKSIVAELAKEKK